MLLKILFIVSLLSSTYLCAYSKKILIASFLSEENANRAFQQIKKKLNSNPKISSLEKSGVILHKRKSGKYYIIALEPFKNISTLYKALRVVKKEYKGAYYNDFKSKKEKVSDPKIDIKLDLPQKESRLFQELYSDIVKKSKLEKEGVIQSSQERKIELLSQKSMDAYLQEMQAYKKELNEVQEPISTPFQNKKEEFQLKASINDFLMAIALLMLLFYSLKFTIFKR